MSSTLVYLGCQPSTSMAFRLEAIQCGGVAGAAALLPDGDGAAGDPAGGLDHSRLESGAGCPG